jgi:GGDEF domain-containing protein
MMNDGLTSEPDGTTDTHGDDARAHASLAGQGYRADAFQAWLASPTRPPARPAHARFGMALIDLVDLARVNHAYGADIGDEVLSLAFVVISATPPCLAVYRRNHQFAAMLELQEIDHARGWGEAVRLAIGVAVHESPDVPADASVDATIVITVGARNAWPTPDQATGMLETLDYARTGSRGRTGVMLIGWSTRGR